MPHYGNPRCKLEFHVVIEYSSQRLIPIIILRKLSWTCVPVCQCVLCVVCGIRYDKGLWLAGLRRHF